MDLRINTNQGFIFISFGEGTLGSYLVKMTKFCVTSMTAKQRRQESKQPWFYWYHSIDILPRIVPGLYQSTTSPLAKDLTTNHS